MNVVVGPGRSPCRLAGLSALALLIVLPASAVDARSPLFSTTTFGSAIACDAVGNVYAGGNTGDPNFPVIGGFARGPLASLYVTKFDPTGGIVWSICWGPGATHLSALRVDAAGDVYIAGETTANPFPSSPGTPVSPMGLQDLFVAKIKGDGSAVLWAFAFGGSGMEYCDDMALDASGNVYLCGATNSADFSTSGTQVGTFAGGEAFVLKVSAVGTAIAWSRFLGGNNLEEAVALAVDSTGAVKVTGYTDSTDFPLVNAFHSTVVPGLASAFVTSLDAGTGVILWSSLFGGNASASPHDLAVDAAGNILLAGTTASTDLGTPGAYSTTESGNIDGFVAKIAADGSAVLWCTYLGGSGNDQLRTIALDAAGAVYVAGMTDSSDFPLVTAFDGTFAGTQEVFVSKLSSTGASLLWSSYLGGSQVENVFGIAVDSTGSAAVTGPTTSPDFPTTPGAWDRTLDFDDAFVTKVAPSGSVLAWSTFLDDGNPAPSPGPGSGNPSMGGSNSGGCGLSGLELLWLLLTKRALRRR